MRRLKHPELSRLNGLGAIDPGPARPRKSAEKRRSAPRPNPGALAKAQVAAEEAVEQWEDGDHQVFADASPRLLVGLYAVLHERVYGVPADELARDWAPAVAAAGRMLEKQFSGSAGVMARYIQWTWSRENYFEQKRRDGDGGTARRIGWRLQFKSESLVTDFRVEAARRMERGKRS